MSAGFWRVRLTRGMPRHPKADLNRYLKVNNMRERQMQDWIAKLAQSLAELQGEVREQDVLAWGLTRRVEDPEMQRDHPDEVGMETPPPAPTPQP